MKDEDYFLEAAKEARKSTCLRDKCGAVVVLNNEIIGKGFNGPPNNDLSHRKCGLNIVNSRKPKSDRTCCVHAEWRAIIDGIKNKKDIKGSTLYFTRVDAEGNILRSGEPYCTVCSRLALDNGIKFFGLWHDPGIKLYDACEYNEFSYQFHAQ
jgi:deoxycytidylate deaminase